MNIDTFKNQKIVLLGKSRAFSDEEFRGQLDVHGITLVDEVQEDVEWIIEGRMMTPYEQNEAEKLYEKGRYHFLNIDSFEKMLAQQIQENTLLMALKLSGDKQRLKAFLQNSYIPDRLFFKLLGMYNYNGEDFFENDDNRDVTAALISRFYENIERNHNVQYATTGLFHLVEQTSNPELLEAIASLEPVKLHPKLLAHIAIKEATPTKVLQQLLLHDDNGIIEAMAYNSALDRSLVESLVAKGESFASIVAQNIVLDEEKYALLYSYSRDLAFNETLTSSMQEQLFTLGDASVHLALAHNPNLSLTLARKLLTCKDEKIIQALYSCVNVPAFLEEGFADEANHQALAKNPATPSVFLEKLYATGDATILASLACNENTPVDILYQLQLDARFERYVKTNEAFGQHIQSQNIGWLL